MIDMLVENLADNLKAILVERRRIKEREAWQNEMAFLQDKPLPTPKVRFFMEEEEVEEETHEAQERMEEIKKEIELSLQDKIGMATSKYDLRNLFMEVMLLEDPIERQQLKMQIKSKSEVLNGK